MGSVCGWMVLWGLDVDGRCCGDWMSVGGRDSGKWMMIEPYDEMRAWMMAARALSGGNDGLVCNAKVDLDEVVHARDVLEETDKGAACDDVSGLFREDLCELESDELELFARDVGVESLEHEDDVGLVELLVSVGVENLKDRRQPVLQRPRRVELEHRVQKGAERDLSVLQHMRIDRRNIHVRRKVERLGKVVHRHIVVAVDVQHLEPLVRSHHIPSRHYDRNRQWGGWRKR